jgi:hypothetical protein
MKYTNSWKANAKKENKINVIVRLGKLTFINFSLKLGGEKKFVLTVLNFTIKN